MPSVLRGLSMWIGRYRPIVLRPLWLTRFLPPEKVRHELILFPPRQIARLLILTPLSKGDPEHVSPLCLRAGVFFARRRSSLLTTLLGFHHRVELAVIEGFAGYQLVDPESLPIELKAKMEIRVMWHCKG